MVTVPWTEVADLTNRLRKQWAKGRYLQAYASGEPWQEVTFPVRGPTATEFLEDFDRARQWAERFHRDSRTKTGDPRFTVEHRVVQGRGLGTNELPSRVRIESFEQLCALLGTGADVTTLDVMLERTAKELPALLLWMKNHPMAALEHHSVWPELLATVRWMAAHTGIDVYLRHIDVPGVDTKFVEAHQRVLRKLLPLVLPPGCIDEAQRSFAARFGFREKPHYTRLRLLAPVRQIPTQLTELQLRTDELAQMELDVRTVFIVENEVSYLAFPAVSDAVVVFGQGFGLTALERLPWLHGKQLVYWGDIDTHGFAILDRLRARFRSVRSILMDEETLLAHRRQLVTEPDPVSDPLHHLTDEEQSLYRDLVDDRFGQSIRLEQERIRFSQVHAALDL